MAPFLSVLPHAALRKLMISHFLRPLKPVPVTAPASKQGPPDDDEADDFLRETFTSDRSIQRWRGRACRTPNTDGCSECSDRSIWVQPQESLEVKNSKEFLIAQLDGLSATDLAARLL